MGPISFMCFYLLFIKFLLNKTLLLIIQNHECPGSKRVQNQNRTSEVTNRDQPATFYMTEWVTELD